MKKIASMLLVGGLTTVPALAQYTSLFDETALETDVTKVETIALAALTVGITVGLVALGWRMLKKFITK